MTVAFPQDSLSMTTLDGEKKTTSEEFQEIQDI